MIYKKYSTQISAIIIFCKASLCDVNTTIATKG